MPGRMPHQQFPSSWQSDTRNEAGYRPDLDVGSGAASSAADHRGKGPKGYKRSDTRIREDVCDRLADDAEIDASAIEVAVSHGDVSLTGFVNSRREKRLAEDRAEAVLGVSQVRNNLRIRVPGEPIATETGH